MTSKPRILLVDDDEEDFIIISEMLTEFPNRKWTLDLARNLSEARQKIQQDTYDAYLVDYRLGVEVGLDLLNDPGFLNAPLILMTGQGNENTDEEAMKRGAADYLIKSQLSAPLLERSIRYSIQNFKVIQELRQSQEKLQAVYDERLKMEAQILMQDRLASIGLLASSLAHEIGTPLGVIKGRAELIAFEFNPETSVRKQIDIILKQIDRISTLIQSLLNLARGPKTGISESADINASEVLSEVLSLITPELERNNIQIINEMPALFNVIADSGPLHQVYLNLLVNSIHAIQESAKAGRTKGHFIRIFTEQNGNKSLIRLQDSGCGIPADNLDLLFKPFFTTKEIGMGTGLGLATSYRLVESWGGRIFVDSKVNTGATFTLELNKGEANKNRSHRLER